jgi:hypothetical protein
VCSVYGSASKIEAGQGYFEAPRPCGREVTPAKFFCIAGGFEHESAWRETNEEGSKHMRATVWADLATGKKAARRARRAALRAMEK